SGDESGYRQEVEHLEGWCRKNNLCINVKKTKEMIVDFRRGRHAHLPLHVGGSAVEVVSSYRYLGVHLSKNLTWSNNTSSLVRKAHKRLYFLRWLRRAGLGSSVLTSVYRCVVESVLRSSSNVWHGSCSAADRKALQRVVKAAQRSVGVSLPTTTDIHLQMQEEGYLHHEGPHSPSTLTFCPTPLNPETQHCYEYSGGGTPYLHWYRQYPGSRPEFLLLTPESGGYVTKARMSIKVHKEEKKKVDLEISSAAVSDSVLYYCALQPTVTGNPDTLYRNWFYD
ncbi:hypothetical protein NFI96_029967, partial [Prochilodus magdalenae]